MALGDVPGQGGEGILSTEQAREKVVRYVRDFVEKKPDSRIADLIGSIVMRPMNGLGSNDVYLRPVFNDALDKIKALDTNRPASEALAVLENK